MKSQAEKPREVSQLDGSLDWNALRLESLAPGGFGAARAHIWPRLLHVDVNAIHSTHHDEKENEHRDERQIRLDTDRSFVLYPTMVPKTLDLHAKQSSTTSLYNFSDVVLGFHDITTVFQLTLPPEVALSALEKLSLHRLRDSMGSTLEPLTGLMLILQRLLRLADPPFATLLEEHAPLPYAALPHLLTLFSHATPTLPLIQHIFDYLLVRPPLAIVYLVASVTLLRKGQVLKLGGDGDDEGMIHSILTGLPKFADYSKAHSDNQVQLVPEPATTVPGHSVTTPPLRGADDSSLADEVSTSECNMSESHPHIGASPSDMPSARAVEDPPNSYILRPKISVSSPLSASASFDPADIPLPPSAASTPPGSPKLAKSTYSQPAYSLIVVFLLADDLFDRFPPDTPELRLTHTLGPASVMRTWTEDATSLLSDDQAEALVVAGVDIVVREAPEPSSRRAKKGGTRKVRRGEARLLVVGAVLVVGAAVVVGIHSRHGGSGDVDWRILFDTFGAFGERVVGMFGEAQLGL